MVIYVLKNRFISLLDISDLSVNLISEPVVGLGDFASVKFSDLFVNNTVFLFARELIDYSLHLLDVPLVFRVSFAGDPRSAFHELCALLVARVDNSFNGSKSLFKEFVFFNQSSPLTFKFIFNELFIALECLEVFLGAFGGGTG